ncbi:MAG: hypothetical protein WCQ90_06280 [Deltaproteobacteria bacterium]
MSFFDDKETCEVIIVDDGSKYRAFLESSSADISFVPEQYRECKGFVMKADGGNFAKWLHQTKPELTIELPKSDGKLVLRSSDLWLPLAFLASNVALPIYLNLVASYLYDRIRGALRGEKPRVHMEAVYEDKHDGIVKSFRFEGDVDELEKAIKKFDLNKFMDK